jgi:hypothetical protein
MVFDILVGKHAPLLASVFGLLGSICLAIPPIKSWGIRKAALTFDKLKNSRLFGTAAKRGRSVANGNLSSELNSERGFNLAGAAFLFLSFLLLILHALWGQGA